MQIQKEKLAKKLEISTLYANSSKKNAILDLIDKLKLTISDNKKKLKYLEKDYFERKKKVEAIKNKIENFDQRLIFLNNMKKKCFRYINQITRKMESSLNKSLEIDFNLEIDENLSNAEKIRALQLKAKDFQYEMKSVKKNIEELQIKLDSIYPQYESIEHDLQKIKNHISLDEKKITEKKEEMKDIADYDTLIENDLTLISFSSPEKIQEEIEQINLKINKFSDISDETELIRLRDKLLNFIKELESKSKTQKSSIINNIEAAFKAYYKMEELLNDIESFLNILLGEINLFVSLNLSISMDNEVFYITPIFSRNKEKNLQFSDLTTPEKIYFILSLISTSQFIKKTNYIFITNLYLPDRYNKRGSIFRTLRKFIELFEKNLKLEKLNLSFIIDEFKPKKSIKNLNIIRI